MDKREVFTKADLPKVKSKQKKRELCVGTKVKSKPSAKRQKDSLQVLTRSRQQQLINQENRVVGVPVVGLGKARLTARTSTSLASLHSSKAKVSETVSSRKVLGSLQSGVNVTTKLHHDLQRVLGKEVCAEVSPQPGSHHDHSKPSLDGRIDMTSPCEMVSPPSGTTPTLPLPPLRTGPSPASTLGIPLADISQRLVEGLQVGVIFPHSSYLANIKSELRKVLKQSNPSGYEELIGYFTASEPSSRMSPFMNHVQQTMLPTEGTEPAATLPVACKTGVLLDPISSDPDPSDAPRPCSVVGGGAGGVVGGASSSILGGVSAAGVSDTVALNLEVNTSALNINDHTSSSSSPHAGHTPPRPRDFLDLVDSAAMSPHNTATPPDWGVGMPTRPRMFPHKLY